MIKIKHPEWLEYSHPGTTLRLYRDGKLPDGIAGWMLVVSLKHPLRCIYGSDLRAGLALVWQAIHQKIESRFLDFKVFLHRTGIHKDTDLTYCEELDAEIERKEEEGPLNDDDIEEGLRTIFTQERHGTPGDSTASGTGTAKGRDLDGTRKRVN